MSTATTSPVGPVGPAGPVDGDGSPALDVGLARPAVAVLCTALLAAVLLSGQWIQRGEATLSLLVARATGVHDAERIGTAVVFSQDGRLIGYAITLGCTVAFLLVPFVLGTGVVLTVQRTTARRALAALAVAVVVVATVNQVRLLTILSGIRVLGLERGYSATHVLAGTAISTVGVVTAALLFLSVITQPTRRRLARTRELERSGGDRRG